MLKLTIKPGEYLLIGNDIKLVFTGGSSNNMHILIDAPKTCNVVRSTVLEKSSLMLKPDAKESHYKDKKLSQESVRKIQSIIMAEKRSNKTENNEKQT